MGAETSKLRVKFEEDNINYIMLVQMPARGTLYDATIQAVQMYKQTTGKDVSVCGLKESSISVGDKKSRAVCAVQ